MVEVIASLCTNRRKLASCLSIFVSDALFFMALEYLAEERNGAKFKEIVATTTVSESSPNDISTK